MALDSFQQYDAWSRYKVPAKRTWATNGTTDVVADVNVSSNSFILIMPTSAYIGPWYVPLSTIIGGTGFTVTSSNSETAGLTYQYLII